MVNRHTEIEKEQLEHKRQQNEELRYIVDSFGLSFEQKFFFEGKCYTFSFCAKHYLV